MTRRRRNTRSPRGSRKLALCLACLVMGCLSATGYAQRPPNLDNVEVHILPVQGNIYMLVGAGANITVQAGTDGVLVVDTQYAPLSNKILAAIRTISKGPIRYVVNTTYDADHTG